MVSTFDAVIRGAWIYDGSGRPPAVGDVGVRGDRIASLGSLPLGAGGVEIDGRGLALAPGFIDTHTHDDRALCFRPTWTRRTCGASCLSRPP